MLEPDYSILIDDNVYDKNGKLKIVDVEKSALLTSLKDCSIFKLDDQIFLFDHTNNVLIYTYIRNSIYYKCDDYIIIYNKDGDIHMIDKYGDRHFVCNKGIKIEWGYFLKDKDKVKLIAKNRNIFYEMYFTYNIPTIFDITYISNEVKNICYMYNNINLIKDTYYISNNNCFYKIKDNDKHELILKDCTSVRFKNNMFLLETINSLYTYTNVLNKLNTRQKLLNRIQLTITNQIVWRYDTNSIYLYNDKLELIKNLRAYNKPILLDLSNKEKEKYKKIINEYVVIPYLIKDIVDIVKNYLKFE